MYLRDPSDYDQYSRESLDREEWLESVAKRAEEWSLDVYKDCLYDIKGYQIVDNSFRKVFLLGLAYGWYQDEPVSKEFFQKMKWGYKEYMCIMYHTYEDQACLKDIIDDYKNKQEGTTYERDYD